MEREKEAGKTKKALQHKTFQGAIGWVVSS
jgi:hypothetical protein